MTEEIEKKVNVIAQNDPFSAQRPHFDFQALRREGLTHIGELSGKIWTDHNAHDPGVTILEELCYALIDLGYRTTLPMQDLLAQQPRDDSPKPTEDDSPHHENFFTPLEILSCNPTTVLDFRKLLLDIDGVRNAWLEPDDSLSPPYFSLKNLEQLGSLKDETDSSPRPVALNGLYSILIQKEADVDEAKVIKLVVETLSKHRNLCEDFSAIRILRPLEVGICANVDLEETADAATVYEAIIRAVRAYISPEIVYYTLKELLDKGRSIEEIFAGRPKLGSPSAGFVDTEELEALPFRDELHGSDLYAAILNVDGVVAIRNLAFQIADGESNNKKTIPYICVPSGSVAEFSLDRTCVNLQTAQGMLFLDKERIHRRLQEGGKPRRGPEHLDLPIPEGGYRPGLADYYSIQHDFPLVYGIGKGGLPNEATPLRKVQAMQLKGYLLFYDQLLANYLAQIGNLRHLFSLQVESKRPASERHTYFNQDIESVVPNRERLFPRHPGKALSDGSILAVPVANDAKLAKRLEDLKANPLTELLITVSCERKPKEIPHFSDVNKSLREVRIRQSIRDFQLGDYSLELSRDRNGYLFILRFKQTCELLLVSYPRYKNQDEAREAANFAAFLASRPEYYAQRLQQVDPDGSQIAYQYNLVYDPAAYTTYLQFLVENEALYLQRREAFLNHLLARFATQFTDYALLRFGAKVKGIPENRQTVEDKSRFLSRVDDLSRDRGRAYDYMQPAWGTENVSGFEKRASLLAGMQDFRRRHLCKYEVVEHFRMEIEDPNGDLWFSSIDTYPSREKLAEAKRNLIEQLRDPSSYERLQCRTRGFNPLLIGRIFSCVATDENIEVSRYVYASVLKNSIGDVLKESNKKDYATQPLAWKGLSKFIKEIENDNGMELVEIRTKSRLYIDNRQIRCHIDPIITYKWHRYDFHGKPIASSSAPHPSPAAAIEDFAHSADLGNLIVKKNDVVIWSLSPGEGYPPLVSIHAFNNEMEARAWLRFKSDGQIKERYRKDPEPEGQGTRITLTTEGGIELATAIIPQQDSLGIEEYIEHCQAEFGGDTEKLEFRTLPSAYGWRLAQQGKNALAGDDEIMESALLFQDVPGALFGLLDALVAVKDAKNYFTAGTEDNPDYRILLRSSGGILIASTPSYADATERNKNLKLVRGRLMRLHPPLEIHEEPRLYRWKLCRATDEQVVLESSKAKVFDSEAAAKTDFESFIHRVYKEQPTSPVGQQVYAINLKKIEDKYRFVYCLNGPNSEALPLLQSAEEYSADDVRGKYAEFVTALAKMQQKNGAVRVVGTDAASAVLIDNTEDNRAAVDRILEYMQVQYGDTLEENTNPKWIYRLLDRDNPIAKSKKSYPTKKEAQAAMDGICGYKPCREYEPCPKKDIVRVICPKLDPGKYHYALFLGTKDNNGVECATLISYMGYASEDEARKAGEGNWLALIERAADPGNYGDNQIISEKETYAESTGSECDRAGIHLAVKPEAVEKDDVVACAKCYPIRISYKKDDKGNPTLQAIGFHFQGYEYDEETDTSLWRSTIDYSDADQALEAYQLFLTLLGNIESCRIECDEGCYRIHLVEILAESREFDTEAEAWGDMSEVTEDECGGRSCPAQGVRLFAQTATSEAAFVPVSDGDCYRFEVVAKGYVLARHTCDYQSRAERDKAKNELHRWAKGEGFDFSYLPDLTTENIIRQSECLQFNLSKGYFLRSYKALPDQQKSDDQKIVDEWLWLALASSSRNYRWYGYDLRLMLADATCGLLDEGKNLVIVALVSNNLHIRIFDSKGEKVVDKAEHELVGGDPIVDLKKRLMPLPDQSKLLLQNKREIIDKALSIAEHTRGEKEYTNKWYLVNPLESDLEIATIENKNDSGEVDIEAFKELVRAYPVYKKNDGYRFRLYYPENGSRLDEELRICGCHDADDDKQQAVQSFCDQVYIYESTESYPCRAAAEKAFMRFLDLLAEFDNYKNEEETGLGTFSFSIIDRGKVLASHPHNHPDRTSAMRAEQRVRACVGDEGMHLVEHILLRPQTEAHCDYLLPVRTEFDSSNHLCTLEWQEDLDPDDPCSEENNPKLTYVPGADPYSFWATVVLPSWTERFRNSERRHFFRQMLYREVPAMVALNIIWLGPRQMYEFEKAFKSWLSSRRLPSALCQSESDPFCCMVKFIGELCSEPLCPDPDTIAATCDCINSEGIVQDDKCIEASESLFWLPCESGEIPEIIECEGTEVTEITDGTEVVEDSVFTVDVAAVRRTITERTEVLKKGISDVDFKPARSTKSYDRISHFLTNPATLDAFKQLHAQMIQDISQGTRKGKVLTNVYQIAFWYLLDHLVQEHPNEIPHEVKEALPQLLQAMEAKGLVLDDLAKGWKGEVFGELFGSTTAKVVNEYLALIKKG